MCRNIDFLCFQLMNLIQQVYELHMRADTLDEILSSLIHIV